MNKPRKVLFVHDSRIFIDKDGSYYSPHMDDGIKKRYLYLGDQLTFLTRQRKIHIGAITNLNKISSENCVFKSYPDFKSIRNILKASKAKKIIEKEVASHDVLVTRIPGASSAMAVEAAQKHNIPYLVECVGCSYDGYWNYGLKGKLIAHWRMWKQQKIIKESPFVVYVTKKFLQNRYPTKGKSINCSNVVIEEVHEAVLSERLNNWEKRICDEVITLGTVAALDVPFKGQADVIKALSELKNGEKKFKYKLVGQGNPERLQNLIRDLGLESRVEILGSMPHKEVFEFLKIIDVYIQPSKQEGLPRAMIEAMSTGCPALGARTAGIPELVADDNIFKPGDITGIVSKLQGIDKEWMTINAKKNFETSKDYLIEKLNKRRYSFFDQFLSTSFEHK